jgi:hypothetical protein
MRSPSANSAANSAAAGISGPEIPLPASSPDDTQGIDKQQILDIK